MMRDLELQIASWPEQVSPEMLGINEDGDFEPFLLTYLQFHGSQHKRTKRSSSEQEIPRTQSEEPWNPYKSKTELWSQIDL